MYLVTEIISKNKTQDSLFMQPLSMNQDHYLSNMLNQKYPDLEFAYLVWKRDLVKGVGYGLN